MGKSSPAAPAAPDYKGAAEATQKSQMSSQYTPWGQSVYSADPSSPSQYRQDISLTPPANQTADTLMQNYNQMGLLAGQQLGRVGQGLTQPMDLSSMQQVADRSYADQTARLDPQWAQREQLKQTELRNQGLVAGGEAWNNAMGAENMARNDAYTQARLAAISTMPQTYQMATDISNQPLNRYNALMTGAQINSPQFGMTPSANYNQAAQGQNAYNMGLYNTGVSSANSANSGLMSLAGAGLGAYGTYAGLAAMSDRRLKSNIVRIGTHPLGIGIYSYNIFGQRDIGVMADEVLTVKPEAVLTHPSGYLMVDYGRL